MEEAGAEVRGWEGGWGGCYVEAACTYQPGTRKGSQSIKHVYITGSFIHEKRKVTCVVLLEKPTRRHFSFPCQVVCPDPSVEVSLQNEPLINNSRLRETRRLKRTFLVQTTENDSRQVPHTSNRFVLPNPKKKKQKTFPLACEPSQSAGHPPPQIRDVLTLVVVASVVSRHRDWLLFFFSP